MNTVGLIKVTGNTEYITGTLLDAKEQNVIYTSFVIKTINYPEE